MELLGKTEELDPELQPYVEEGGSLGEMLRHPLVYNVPHLPQMNAMMNERLRATRERLAEAMGKKDFALVIWLHERPHRLGAFCSIQHRLSDPQYWKTLGELWVDSENIFQNLDTWIQCLLKEKRNLSLRRIMMSKDERQALDAMPDTLQVFRGCITANADGLSWTLNRDKAQMFATRFSKNGLVIDGECQKEDVIAYFTERGESEIVILPENVQ